MDIKLRQKNKLLSIFIDNFRWSAKYGMLCSLLTIIHQGQTGKWISCYHPTSSSLRRVIKLLQKKESK